jgi:hypothetical protein
MEMRYQLARLLFHESLWLKTHSHTHKDMLFFCKNQFMLPSECSIFDLLTELLMSIMAEIEK